MPARPLFSVLIPTFNAGALLAEALRSVFAQDEDFEIILVDDASTDDTPATVDRCQDPRLRVLRLATNVGVHGALNAGLALCRGELVARLDADDHMPPGRLAAQAAFLQAHPEVRAVGGQAQTFGTQEARLDYPVHPEQARAWALFSCPLAHPATTFRRQSVPRYPALPYAEDYLLWAQLLEDGEIANLEEVMVHWRRHGERVSLRHATAQQVGARVVWTRQLAGLGFHPTAADLELHALLQYARFGPVQVSLPEARAACTWAERLLVGNAQRRRIPPAVLEEELERRLAGLTVQEVGERDPSPSRPVEYA